MQPKIPHQVPFRQLLAVVCCSSWAGSTLRASNRGPQRGGSCQCQYLGTAHVPLYCLLYIIPAPCSDAEEIQYDLVWSKWDISKWGTGLTVRLPPIASMFKPCLYPHMWIPCLQKTLLKSSRRGKAKGVADWVEEKMTAEEPLCNERWQGNDLACFYFTCSVFLPGRRALLGSQTLTAFLALRMWSQT